MPRRIATDDDDETSRRRPASTPDAREVQLIELADQLAERQLREGTASSQVITHFLQLGSSRERIQQERMKTQILLDQAKVEQIKAMEKQEELFARAIKAMTRYQGGVSPESEEEEFE